MSQKLIIKEVIVVEGRDDTAASVDRKSVV